MIPDDNNQLLEETIAIASPAQDTDLDRITPAENNTNAGNKRKQVFNLKL